MSLLLAMMKNHQGSPPPLPAGQERAKALVLISESMSRAEAGFLGLDLLRREGYQLFCTASDRALACWGRERLLALSGLEGLSSAEDREWDNLDESVSLVYLPAVSPGLLGKLAHGIYDEPLTSLILLAQLRGLPVIGILDGVLSEERSGTGPLRRGPGRTLRENRERVAAQGIDLFPSGVAGPELARRLGVRPEAERTGPPDGVLSPRRRVVTRADLEALEENVLTVPAGTILTALARDYAAEMGIEVIIRR
jgi:hypothetical protein